MIVTFYCRYMCWLYDCLLRRMFWNNKLKFVMIHHKHLLLCNSVNMLFCVDVLKIWKSHRWIKIRHTDFVPWLSCRIVQIFVYLSVRNINMIGLVAMKYLENHGSLLVKWSERYFVIYAEHSKYYWILGLSLRPQCLLLFTSSYLGS